VSIPDGNPLTKFPNYRISYSREGRQPQKKAKKLDTGLRSDWLEKSAHSNDDDVEMPVLEESYLPRGHSRSSSSHMSILSAPPTTPGRGSEGLSDEEPGGISDDAGEVGERLALSGRKVDVKVSGSRVGHIYSCAAGCTR